MYSLMQDDDAQDNAYVQYFFSVKKKKLFTFTLSARIVSN